jgi:hypothetical protein
MYIGFFIITIYFFYRCDMGLSLGSGAWFIKLPESLRLGSRGEWFLLSEVLGWFERLFFLIWAVASHVAAFTASEASSFLLVAILIFFSVGAVNLCKNRGIDVHRDGYIIWMAPIVLV